MIDLTGKTAVVTGAARGLGQAIASQLAALGAAVVISDVNEEGAKQAAEALRAQGFEAAGCACNVADAEQAKQLIRYAADTYGRLDILVNNAGITRDAMLHKMEPAQWSDVIGVNLTGVYNCLQPAAVLMRGQGFGRIINISSISWLGNIGQANYAAAKAGVIGLTKTAAKELSGRGITCNAICPGFMDTEMTKTIPDQVKERMIAAIPAARIGKPEDVAQAVAFLASDAAAYITGEVLNVSGGLQV
ncbi:3-oxoacyl-ACP reductase FabG [Ectobacillus ponti]|uniref:3-oxoacyl-[acyl-carrier-protein] reductase n=1 Tax=Ectobacillus ponti TaxID=2961894 RepID=A0AA41X591_9BACI|nr:3-oxoacyl-ACP reductase FabG [Ectobacillus ponti]MCP8969171.1 3-oxoacyl-ACP reductase FabG [Ectobacillus ponti]